MGDLRDLIAQVHTPLAVRSSSLLEDDLDHPFAGVYSTKMIPNNQPDTDSRYRCLDEAIRFVYATTFFASARDYFRATGLDHAREKMAILIQEMVGQPPRGIVSIRKFPACAAASTITPAGPPDPPTGSSTWPWGWRRQIVDGGLVLGLLPGLSHLAAALQRSG